MDSGEVGSRSAGRHPTGIVIGAVCGLVAAVLYTFANIALRGCVGIDPFLVSAVKAAPTVVCLAPVLVWMRFRGAAFATHTHMIPRFMLVALIGQFIGNAAFQVALGVIGLAASVPITLGVLIVGGGVLGKLILGEPVRKATLMAMGTLIVAVVILSLPSASETPRESSLQSPVWVGGLCAAASGAAYALFGVVIRQTLNGGVSAPLTMFISGVVGTVSLWSFTLLRIGIESLSGIDPGQWSMMVAAGVFNFSAFAALSYALKALPVVAVNLINASQVAMAALAGVILFAEPVTVPLVTGIVLTFGGLLILVSGRRQRSTP
ncbi:EamA-like transporter family protein [Rubripirellula lacrimiformis]|uniref:EamA-like transporter family protein n=2 Tax=Rubripirellula lacrimiformis TaxID=1930273 RepID=A0A517N5X1_9BACT|nr:EamA-like transporter family protein [Rubripirellula lacrimiformis]